LGKGDIVIDPFQGSLFGITEGQISNKTGIRIGINAKEKQSQPVRRNAACAQDPFRSRGKFGAFGGLTFLLSETRTGLRRENSDCLRKGIRRAGKRFFRNFGSRHRRKLVRAFERAG
jgi:hypothetical protein